MLTRETRLEIERDIYSYQSSMRLKLNEHYEELFKKLLAVMSSGAEDIKTLKQKNSDLEEELNSHIR